MHDEVRNTAGRHPSRIPGVQEVLARDANVIFAYLFGGLASGPVRALSDVDLAVYVQDAGGAADYQLDLFDRLTNALGTSELDLVILNTAAVSITGRILENRVLLADKDPFRRHAFESRLRREFFDFRVKEQAFFSRRHGVGR